MTKESEAIADEHAAILLARKNEFTRVLQTIYNINCKYIPSISARANFSCDNGMQK